MKKRLIAMLLFMTMVFSSFVACSEQTEETTDTADTETAAPSEGEETAGDTPVGEGKAELIDQVEKKDYGGYGFKYLALASGINGTTRFVDEMWVEEMNEEVINNATYYRNMFISDRLNVEIGVTPVSDVAGTLHNDVTAGDNSYDMAGAYKDVSISLAVDGLIRDWNTLDIDYSQPWWSQGAVEKLRIDNYQFLMSGNILISELDDTLAMIYNKAIITNYNMEDIYSIVAEGRWTLDKFMEMTSAVSGDLNGDGEMKPGDDLFGYIQDPASMTVNWIFSCDLLNSKVDEDGAFNFNVDTERVQGMLDKLAPYFATDNVYSGLDLYDGLIDFQDNKIFVYAIILCNLELLRDMETDFGVIPYPMYDEAQGRYITHVGSASPILSIPILNADDDERLADILEAMAISSRQYLLPAYYETALKGKIARDPETATMLDIIVDSKTYDITYILDKGLVNTVRPLISKGSTNFASSWAKSSGRNEKLIQKSIDKILEAGKAQSGHS